MTTGATVGACASVLMEAGATAVDVITVARGI
jgi:predicted amidophosphoribosyltransferase